MSRPSNPESPTPPGDAPPAARRRIRVAGGQLQRGELDAPHPPPPPPAEVTGSGTGAGVSQPLTLHVGPPTVPSVIEGTPGLPTAASNLPVEISGFFRHLHDTAQALSQHIGMLTVGIPGQTASGSDARPLPMRERRPHRVEAGRINSKRSARFGNLKELPAKPSAEGFAPAEIATGDTPILLAEPENGERSTTDISAAADPSVPLPASVHNLSSGPPAVLFQPRNGYSPIGEEDLSRPAGAKRPWGLVAAAFALGLIGSWLFDRLTAPAPTRTAAPANARGGGSAGNPVPSRVPTDPAATARATTLVGQALRAEKSGDLPKAADLFTEVEKVCPDFPGIHYRLALLALRRGEKSLSRTLLGRSLESGEEVAAVHNLQSALARLENQPQLGFAELEAATRADPFNPKYFYFWAEALRRAGRLPEAAEKMEEALVRTTDPTDESLYQFKLRLVKIELDREAEFTADLAAWLQGANVAPPEWLLTAAALALKRGDYAVAASYIERARQLLVPATAFFLLNDQTFRDNSWRPELAPFYAGPLMTSVLPRPTAALTPPPAPAPVLAPPQPVANKPKPTPPPAASRQPEPTPTPLPSPSLPPTLKFRTGGGG